MRDLFNVFFGFGDRHSSKKVYNLVNTHDTFPSSNNPYNATTTAVNESWETNTTENRCPSPGAFIDRLFNGKLSQKEKQTKSVLLTMFIGLISISLGTLLLVYSPYDIILRIKTTFSEGAEGFEMWATPPVEVFLKVYLYNITNKDAFLAGKEKLRVQQVGPYVYRETGVHADPKFNHENGTITSIPKYPLEWVPELSNGTEDDILTLPNVALLSFANVIAKSNFMTKMGVNFLISETKTYAIVQQSAKEFMFGYQSALVTLGNTFIPDWIYFDKLGLIDRMYDFTGDISTTYTGETDNHLSGIFETYNNLSYLPQWSAPCNKLNGSSDGTKFPTNIKPFEPLSFFRKSMCRSMPMVRANGATTSYAGIPTVHYRFKEDALDYGEKNEDNKCFCSNGHCLRSGLIDVTHCYYGFPIALSYPHFYLADPWLREEVEGSNPDPNLHETYFHINPETGTPTNLSVKMQINIALGDVSSMLHCEKFSNMVIPMLWTDITMPELSRPIVIKLFLLLRVLPVVETVALYLFLIGGMAFVLLSICAVIFISTAKVPMQSTVKKASSSPMSSSSAPASSKSKHLKSEYLGSEKSLEGNKEMDMYYCSLLAPSNEKEEA